jgi:hypothetical protein
MTWIYRFITIRLDLSLVRSRRVLWSRTFGTFGTWIARFVWSPEVKVKTGFRCIYGGLLQQLLSSRSSRVESAVPSCAYLGEVVRVTRDLPLNDQQ